MMNSMATCLTLRGMGSVRLYLACDSPYDENKQPYHTGSVVAWVKTRTAPSQVTEGHGEQGKMEETGCEIIYGALRTLVV